MDSNALLGWKKVQPIVIEEWNQFGPFTIRSITGAERARIAASFQSEKDDSKVETLALMVALALGDKDGNRVFSDEQAPRIKDLPVRITDYIREESRKFNYLHEEALDDAKKS